MKRADCDKVLDVFWLLDTAIAEAVDGQVTMPLYVVEAVKEALSMLPGPVGRRRVWSEAIMRRARSGVHNDEQIKPLAREIAALTGQSVPSVRSRLQEMKRGRAKRRAKAK